MRQAIAILPANDASDLHQASNRLAFGVCGRAPARRSPRRRLLRQVAFPCRPVLEAACGLRDNSLKKGGNWDGPQLKRMLPTHS
jgi:hypothetical protein